MYRVAYTAEGPCIIIMVYMWMQRTKYEYQFCRPDRTCAFVLKFSILCAVQVIFNVLGLLANT